jgi:four helix bundle protein
MNYEIEEEVINSVKEWRAKYEVNLRERLLNFSVNVIQFLSSLPVKGEYEVFRIQLSKSATSIGANYEESQHATYREFTARLRIVMREAVETKYWLKIIDKMQIGDSEKRTLLVNEIDEIVRIFGAILSKFKDSR